MKLGPVLMVALVAGCGDSGPSFKSNCEANAPSEEALARDGSRLYVSNGGHDPMYGIENDMSKHYNVVEVFDIAGSPPQLAKTGEIHLPFAGAATKLARMPSGMALSSDGKTLYVACQ